MFRFLKSILMVAVLAILATQSSARFLQPDWFEVTKPGVGTNRYAYCNNDPVNCRDPGGNQFLDPIPGIPHDNVVMGVVMTGAAVVAISIMAGRPGGLVNLPSPNQQPPTIDLPNVMNQDNASVSGLQSDGSFVTPGGYTIGNHGKKGTGEGYLSGNGHTPETVDDIFSDPLAQGAGAKHDNSTGIAKEGTAVTVGKNGDWAVTNTKTGKVIQVNDRNNSKQKTPEFENELDNEDDDDQNEGNQNDGRSED